MLGILVIIFVDITLDLSAVPAFQKAIIRYSAKSGLSLLNIFLFIGLDTCPKRPLKQKGYHFRFKSMWQHCCV